jgi:DNA-binding NarL/FixJ family response regulator
MAARTLKFVHDIADDEVRDAAAPASHVEAEPLDERQGEAASADDDDLVAAVALLTAHGYRVIAPGQADADEHPGSSIVEEPHLHDDAPPPRNLSAREREVLMLLSEGAPNKVIARRLDISVHTAKFHVASILAKLGAANRTDAIATAMREGLILI